MNNIKDATILIVDDNLNNLKVLCGAIADYGWEILVATDGETALEQAEYANPDLILLDVMMPIVDGFETCKNLKANTATHEIPVIFMTALSDTVDKVKGLSIGAVDYITKPFQTEEVLARINIHLKLRFLTKQLEEQKQDLEKRVLERTAELSNTLHELQESQLQLVQSEKMSTLGQLVAGVAHEVNNPLGFISGNFSLISQYTSDMISHLKLYHKYYPNPAEEILEDAESIYLDDVIKELPEIIGAIKLGTDRIRNISNSLRNFSRSDTVNKVSFNVHEGIDSTLMILKHRLKANEKRPEIEVIKNYGELPLIECYSGQLNQVFMNIISNAIDALEEYTDSQVNEIDERLNTITISTQINSSQKFVSISIKDNASGMPEEVRNKIFEQFFTTKNVGKGTGLGLSISKQIVEDKHQGKLSCFSQFGQGTEFLIEIPMQ
ncbi:MAG: response regulator [Scytonematopsis contorta HA4267-MV1]|jgi:signal transduction histidine kinase|nr:response regulator [Scytonematopsis contorta HA4267-MV1]